MHLFKNFFRLLRNNKSGLIIYGIIFIVMITALIYTADSMAGTSSRKSSELSSVTVSYVDHDGSELSKGLISLLSKKYTLIDMEGRSESSIQDMVFFLISFYHLDIEEGFSEGKGGMTYLSDYDSSASLIEIDNVINDYVNAYRQYQAMGYSDSEAAQKASDLLLDATEITVVSENASEDNGGKDVVVHYINQFYAYLVIGFLCLGIGYTVIANNDKTVCDRIECSTVSRKKISFVNTAGLLVSGLFIWIVFMIINIVLGSDSSVWKDFWWIIVPNSFVTTLVACSIASLITSFDITSNTLSMITNIVSLSMAFICGAFVPQYVLSEGLLKIARFLPMYWSVYANNMTNQKSHIEYDLNMFLVSIGIQFLFAVAFSVAAAYVKSSRLGKTKV